MPAATSKPVTPDAAEVNLDPYTFEHDGAEYTIPSFGAAPAGVVRRNRNASDADMLFAILESLVDGDALDAIDSMVGPDFAEFVEGWQRAAGVSLPN